MSGAKQTGQLMTTPEASEYLRYKVETLKWWRSHGGGPPFIKINGRLVRYRVRDLDAWLDKRTVGAA